MRDGEFGPHRGMAFSWAYCLHLAVSGNKHQQTKCVAVKTEVEGMAIAICVRLLASCCTTYVLRCACCTQMIIQLYDP